MLCHVYPKKLLAELVSRSSLIALMYQSAQSAEHSFDEHVAIVDASGTAQVIALRNEGVITEEVMQRVQRDIDLEDSRLDA